MPETIERRIRDFGQQISPGSWFLSGIQEIEEHRELLPYAHYLRQAWSEIGLSGVLCVDGRPTVYLCEGNRFSPEQKRDRHRFVWNQGLVPLLVFVTSSRLEVHSTVKMPTRAPAGDELFESGLASLIPNLGNIAEALEIARFVRSVETGKFFQDHAEFFPTDETVDRCLLKNLVHTARKLHDAGWDLPRAHALLGRALFVCFLHEREFIKPDYYPDGTRSLLDILTQPRVDDIKRLLYREFFPRLRQEFNGTMFDTALAEEERHINKTHLDALAHFLGHHDVESGQMTFGFWAYDFRFIPVEIISAIYEEFMKGADLEKKRTEGAYYTPRHLAETTLRVALENRYAEALKWRVLDPACGSGIFLVAMFNLIAEHWRRENASRRKQTKAQAMLDILQKQIRGVDLNPDACRIAAFSLYLALFEKLQPIDVEEFKDKVRQGPFLPPLLWSATEPGASPVILQGDFLKDHLPLHHEFDLVIGNPPWESRGKEQIALHFALRSADFVRKDGLGCLLLPSAILVNRNGALDVAWFRKVTVEKIVQLADFRFVLFQATHPCFILRYQNRPANLEHTLAYETPKLNRFDRRQGVIVVEPDDQKLVSQHDIVEAGLQNRLQSLWSRKFWGTPRDESFLRRLDFYPHLSEVISARKWGGGVGCQPYYPGVSPRDPEPLEPWKLSDKFLSNRAGFPQLVLQTQDLITLNEGLEEAVHRRRKVKASTKYLRRKPGDEVFTSPMVLYSKGFTKCTFCNVDGNVRFFDGLRSITGPKADADLLRFVSAVLGSRLFRYITFHSGSNSGIARDQIHVYESMALPFPLPEHELAATDAHEIVREVADILRELERTGENAPTAKRADLAEDAWLRIQPLVERYFSVTETERILIDDTLAISQPSIHRSSLDGNVPSLVFPEIHIRKSYADTLVDVLSKRTRKQDIRIRAEGRISITLNLFCVSVLFGNERKPYKEVAGDAELWLALDRVSKAAQHHSGPFSYLRGFTYLESDRLHMLKPATVRNWSRTAALNDADEIFEHLAGQEA
jgi:N-6 DNA Methylase